MTIYLYIMLLVTMAYVPVHYYAGRSLRRHLGWQPYLILAVLFLLGTITPRAELFLLACLIAPLIRPGTRVDVACRYALLMPLIPDVTLTLKGGGHVFGQLTPFDAFGFGSLLATMVARAPAEPRPAGFRPEHGVVLMLLVIFGVASPRFGDLSALVRAIINYLVLLGIPFAIITRSIRTREELTRMIACLGVSAVLLSVPALYERHAGWALFDPMTVHLNPEAYLARSSSIRGGALRSSVTMGTPIEFGIFLTMGLMALYLTRALFRRGIAVPAMMGFVFLGVLAAQSRGALLATVVGALVVLLAQRRWLMAGGVIGLGALGYTLLRLASATSVRVAAFMGAGQNVGAYRDYRTLLLDRGLQEGAKHRWLGASLDQVTDELADLTQGEHIVDFVNSYLNIYLVAGLLGLGLLLAALAAVYAGLLRQTGSTLRGDTEIPRVFCLAALTSLLLSLVTTSFYGRVPFMLMLLVAIARVVRATDARRQRWTAIPVLDQLRRQAGARAPA